MNSSTSFRATVSWAQLLKDKQEDLKQPDNEAQLLRHFTRVRTSAGDAMDSKGYVLGCRLKVEHSLISNLSQSFSKLPVNTWSSADGCTGHDGNRGTHKTRHYEVWKEYAPLSKDYTADRPLSGKFISSNKALFDLAEREVRAT